MRCKYAVVLTSLLAIAGAENARAAERSVVIIQLIEANALGEPLLARTRALVDQIMESAGVELTWEVRKFKGNISECGGPADAKTITVRFLTNTPVWQSGQAYAAARPFAHEGVGITVFYDRMRPSLLSMSRPEILLAHVIAHEIGHVLMRTDAHANTGLMKARWGLEEIKQMRKETLTFEPRHVRAIQALAGQGCTGSLSAKALPPRSER